LSESNYPLAYDLLRGFMCCGLGSIPIPRQEFCHTIDFVIGDAGQDITDQKKNLAPPTLA